MREIKFRAWNLFSQSMITAPALDWTTQDILVALGPDALEMPLMQYTGLKDKNGVEIYEGDVVKEEDIVEGVAWDYQLLAYFQDDATWESNENCRCEVIGNIYENPELLSA